jgi:hypothetical protein
VLGRPEFEQLRQRVTVRYHLRPLDPGETAAYINHRLKKAAIGAPLVLSSEVTDLIGQASQGLPRKINVIADAVLLFGYGEDKHAIEADLVREVITELEATGVLAPSMSTTIATSTAASAPNVSAATAVHATQPSPEAAAAAAAAIRAAAEAAAATERALAEREAAIVRRERELAEQFRVLTEQYRLMKAQQSQPAIPQAKPAAPWLSRPAAKTAAPAASRTPAPQPAQAARIVRHDHRPIPSFWTRLRRGLLGVGKPLFED